jgi:hypothetical protein
MRSVIHCSDDDDNDDIDSSEPKKKESRMGGRRADVRELNALLRIGNSGTGHDKGCL